MTTSTMEIMGRPIALAFVPAVLLLAVCSSDADDGVGTVTATPTVTATSTGDASEARRELAAARQRWHALGVVSYEFELRWQCFCPPPLTDPVIVTVRDGFVDSVTDLDGGKVDYAIEHQTVGALFEWLDAALDDADEVTVSYDPETGVPIAASVNPDRDLFDDESGFEVRTLEVLAN